MTVKQETTPNTSNSEMAAATASKLFLDSRMQDEEGFRESFKATFAGFDRMSDKIAFLRMISDEADGVLWDRDARYYAGVKFTLDSLERLSADTDQHRLLRIVAQLDYDRMIHKKSALDAGIEYYDDDSPLASTMEAMNYFYKAPDNTALDEEYRQLYLEDGDSMHAVGPDMVAVYDIYFNVKQLYVDGQNVLSAGLVTDEHLSMLKVLHDPKVGAQISDQLAFCTTDIPFQQQLALLSYMDGASSQTYDRLCQQIRNSDNKQQLIDAFLATEFGDDLGDIILTLTEREPSSQMIEHLQSIRQDGSRIARHFGEDQDIDSMVATAFIKRATELLALAEVDGYAAVAEEIGELREVIHEIAVAIETDKFSVHEATTQYGTLRAAKSPVTITARPYGRNARLGMTVRGRGIDKKQRINVRLDYEDGKVSLDIGSTARDGVNSSEVARKIGIALAKGELALANRRAQRAIEEGARSQEITLHGNHIQETFDALPEILPEEFSSYVNTFLYSLTMIDPTEQQKAA